MRPDPIAALAEAWGRGFSRRHGGKYTTARQDSSLLDYDRDHVAPLAQEARRARKAAKRAENERRTAEGRALRKAYPGLSFDYRPDHGTRVPTLHIAPAGFWDAVASGFAIADAFAGCDDYEAPLPRWKWRSRERRALPGMERPWFESVQFANPTRRRFIVGRRAIRQLRGAL